MQNKFPIIIVLMILLIGLSCEDNIRRKEASRILQQWKGKEIVLPAEMAFTRYALDTVDYRTDAEYKILVYVDSVGCTGCKAKFTEWKAYMAQMNSATNDSVPFIFVIHPRKRDDIRTTLRSNGFNHPVLIDMDDVINKRNHFPTKLEYQTFLLDKDNRVVLVGNPVHNTGIGQLYIGLIKGK